MASYAYTFTSGDTVTPTKLNNARTVSDIVNADIKSDAAIAGTKISPAFGAQDITVSGANRSITNTGNFALSFGTNNTERVRIDNSGNLGIGTASPTARLAIVTPAAQATAFILSDATNYTLRAGFTAAGVGYIGADTGSALALYSNNTERMRIDASGNVLIGRTSLAAGSAGWYFGPSGISRGDLTAGQVFTLNRVDIDGTAIQFQRNAVAVGGISVTATATNYGTSSDHRLKQNVEPMVNGLVKLAQLNPITFEFKAEPNVKVDGFIAHEVQAVVPQAVTGEKDGERIQGLDMSKLVPVLVAAVQELSAKVEALEAA